MTDEDKIRELLGPLSHGHDRLRDDLLRKLPERELAPEVSRSARPARSFAPLWAAAAALLVGLWLGGLGVARFAAPDPAGQSVAERPPAVEPLLFERVLQAVERFETVRYNRLSFAGGQVDQIIQYRVDPAGAQRLEYFTTDWMLQQVVVTDLRARRAMTHDAEQTTAMLFTFEGDGLADLPADTRFSETHLWDDLRPTLDSIPPMTAAAMPEKMLDGRHVIGFFYEGDPVGEAVRQTTVWVDFETLLPVQIETTFSENPWMSARVVWRNFQFGEEFDPGLFSTNAPEGATLLLEGEQG